MQKSTIRSTCTGSSPYYVQFTSYVHPASAFVRKVMQILNSTGAATETVIHPMVRVMILDYLEAHVVLVTSHSR